MNAKLYTPFACLVALIMVVSLACGPTPTATTEPVAPTATQEVKTEEPKEPDPTKPPAPPPTEETSGAIREIGDVKQAIIQIEAQGTFIDPQFGLVPNAAGRGSGFIIDPSGIAVTNNHVVTGAALLKVWVGGDTGKTYNARVLGVSECSDLAVIDIEGDGFPFVDWYQGTAKVGLEVYAAGFPLGDPEFTLTKGIVSKEKADGETSWASVDAVIEHDATINPGNSGGPLMDANGRVVGINYAGSSSTNQYFAIGREVAIPLIEKLREGADVDSVGINGQAVMSEDGSLAGIWVSSVKSGSPADEAGLQGGDIVMSMEGLSLGYNGTMEEYCDILRTHNPGDTMSLEVLRWQTQEYLKGQLNGRELEVAASFAAGLEEEASNMGEEGSSAGTGYSGYYEVSDDSGIVLMNIPVEWYDVDGTAWKENWGDYSFDAPSISAAADLDAYFNTYSESGVFFAASPDLAQIGGYVQLLDGVRGWHEDSCTLDGRYDYGEGDWADPWYEGQFDLWIDCGPDETMVLVLSARPKDNPTAYLILLEIKITQDADLAALDEILATFQANY